MDINKTMTLRRQEWHGGSTMINYPKDLTSRTLCENPVIFKTVFLFRTVRGKNTVVLLTMDNAK